MKLNKPYVLQERIAQYFHLTGHTHTGAICLQARYTASLESIAPSLYLNGLTFCVKYKSYIMQRMIES